MPGAREFLLYDPKEEMTQQIFVKTDSNSEAANLPHKRTTKTIYEPTRKRTKYFERVSLIAFEGSTLTLLGLLKYEPTALDGKGAFQMTEVAGFLAGGLKECQRMLEKQVANLKGFLTLCGILTGLFGLISYFVIYGKISRYIVNKRLEQMQQEEL